MARKQTKVFVSYSRHDEALVKPLAGLLGVAADDAVFLDVSELKPGDLWEEKIIGAVKEASVFVLCWCCESEKSTFVAKEIGTALSEGKKRLVPVLFCSTKLPDSLANRQWIDLRGRIVHVCNHADTATRPSPPSPAAPTPAPSATASAPAAQAANAPAPRKGSTYVPRDVSSKPLHRMRPRRSRSPNIMIGCIFLLLAMIGSSVYLFARHGANIGLLAVLLVAVALLVLIALIVVRRPATKGRPKPEDPRDVIASRARSYFEGLGR